MKNNKPKIRFKDFTGPWEQRKLGDVAKYRNGKAHENDISEQGKFIVVNSKFVSTNGEVRKFSNKQIEPLFKNEIAFVLSDVPNGRAIARTFLVDKNDKYTLNQRIAGITPIEDVCPYYLHILMNRNKYFLQFDDGAKQTNLSVTDVMEFAEHYPSGKEQRQIGMFFQQLDHLITLHQRKCDNLKKIKKAMLEKLFPKNGNSIPEVRFKGFTDDWEQRKLGELVDVCNGRDYKHLKEGTIPVYGTGGYMLSVNEALSYDKDAIGIGRKGTIDKPYILYAPFWTVDTLFYAIPAEKFDLHFAFDIFQNIDWKMKDESTGVPSLSKTAINNIDIFIPKYYEQQFIGRLFSNLDHLITLHQRKADTKKLLTGKIFV